jgi:hypothetical protein
VGVKEKRSTSPEEAKEAVLLVGGNYLRYDPGRFDAVMRAISESNGRKRFAIMREKTLGTTKMLLDNGIRSHSEFAEEATTKNAIRWAGRNQIATIHGIRRKAPHKDAKFQAEIEALPTVGRIIREEICNAFEYREIWCEGMRYRPLAPFGNALEGCKIQLCPPAIDRSKFAQTVDLADYFAKGGKKDREAGIQLGRANQVAFFEWLAGLTSEFVEVVISHAQAFRLTDFEIDSFRDIGWFQFLCDRGGSRENYPDIFHLWTAERNGLDVLLTLDNGLPELVSRVKNEKRRGIEIQTQVLRPLELLNTLGISGLDAVQLEHDGFYYLHELC